jgi:hypothetical protein
MHVTPKVWQRRAPSSLLKNGLTASSVRSSPTHSKTRRSRVGNSSRAFSEVRNYVEMKVRTLLTRRKRRRKSSVGWRRWSNEYLYDVLGLYCNWKIQPLPGLGEPLVKAVVVRQDP